MAREVRKSYFMVGAGTSTVRGDRLFRDVLLPSGETTHVMSKAVFEGALNSAGKKIREAESKHKSESHQRHRRPMMWVKSIGSTDLLQAFRPTVRGEPINHHVVPSVREPEPDYDELQRIIRGERPPGADMSDSDRERERDALPSR